MARVAQAERPPAAVGGRPEHRVRAVRRGQRGQAAARSASAPACGVSMPSCRVGQAGQQRGGVRRARRRSGRRGRSPRCGSTVTPRSAAASSAPRAAARQVAAERDDHPHPGHRRARCRGCPAARPRPASAACCGVAGGHSRVFTRPGTGALASTITATAAHRPPERVIRQQPGHVAGGPDRAEHRAGDLRAAAGPPRVAHRDLGEPPAGRPGAQQQLQRVAERAVGDPELEQRLPGGPPGSARCRAPGRRGAAAGRRSARCRPGRATATPRPSPAPAGRPRCRPPRTRPARPCRAAPPDPASRRRRGTRPARPGRATVRCGRPRRSRGGARAPPGPRAPRATAAVSSVEPLSTTSTGQPAGSERSTDGSASASSRHGRTISAVNGHARIVGAERRRDGAIRCLPIHDGAATPAPASGAGSYCRPHASGRTRARAARRGRRTPSRSPAPPCWSGWPPRSGGPLLAGGTNLLLPFPPLLAELASRTSGPGTPVAVAVAGPGRAARTGAGRPAAPGAPLLRSAYAAAAAWTLALALVDGWQRGVVERLTSDQEYLHDVPRVTDIPAMLATFADHILTDRARLLDHARRRPPAGGAAAVRRAGPDRARRRRPVRAGGDAGRRLGRAWRWR